MLLHNFSSLTRDDVGDLMTQVETQDTASKLSRTRGLKPFQKGSDSRRNTRGRPKTFDMLREIAQRIGAETIQDDNGDTIMRIEEVLRSLASSRDPQAKRIFLEYGYGKPVDKIETNLAPKTTLRLFYGHEEPGRQQPIAVNSEGTLRPLLPDAD
jgi:hypothetical protein